MLLERIIPCLLIKNGGFVKTRKFKNPDYVGDPVNVINLFNRFEVDEIIILDIGATRERRSPDFHLIDHLASECWVPLAYGGGVRSMEHAKKIFSLGIEKIIINSAITSNPDFISELVQVYGSQAVVASVDIGKDFFGRYVCYTHSGRKKIKAPVMEYLKFVEGLGVGEVFVNFIDRDGTWDGYDNELTPSIIETLSVPVVICGGAGSRKDFIEPLSFGASAAAAGSLFVYKGKDKGVLINYPERPEIDDILRASKHD